MDELNTEKKSIQEGAIQTPSFYETTFAREAEFWLEDLSLRASPGHLHRCKGIINDFNVNYGNLEPNRIDTGFLTKLQKKLKTKPGRLPGLELSNASVNRYTEVICAVLNFSASQKRIPHSPVTGFRKLPKNSPEMLFWDEKEAGSFLAWGSLKYTNLSNQNPYTARKNYIAYLLALNTGMRAGEIWGLKPRDLFFNANGMGDTIFVRRQLNTLTLEYAPLKGAFTADKNKSRHVPCSKELRKELEALIEYNKIGNDAPVFQNTAGKIIYHNAFTDRFDRDIAAWGGRWIRFHDLRHTAATLMLSKGIDMKTVSEILGHENLSTTMTYVHLLGDRIKQVSKSFSVQPNAPQKTPLYLVKNS